MRHLARIGLDEQGATAIEYALIAALIAMTIVGGLSTMADNTIALFNDVANKVDNSIN
jgi:pilus assembly protein Flp/PilA